MNLALIKLLGLFITVHCMVQTVCEEKFLCDFDGPV